MLDSQTFGNLASAVVMHSLASFSTRRCGLRVVLGCLGPLCVNNVVHIIVVPQCSLCQRVRLRLPDHAPRRRLSCCCDTCNLVRVANDHCLPDPAAALDGQGPVAVASSVSVAPGRWHWHCYLSQFATAARALGSGRVSALSWSGSHHAGWCGDLRVCAAVHIHCGAATVLCASQHPLFVLGGSVCELVRPCTVPHTHALLLAAHWIGVWRAHGTGCGQCFGSPGTSGSLARCCCQWTWRRRSSRTRTTCSKTCGCSCTGARSSCRGSCCLSSW